MKLKFIYLSVIVLSTVLTSAQNLNIDYNQFIRETQKNSSESGKINIVWWIPLEFWDITLKRNKTLSEDQIKKFIDELKPYSMFAVIQGEMGPMGNLTYVPLDSIKNSIVLLDNNQKKYYPIAYDQLDAGLQSLLTMLKPVLKNSMGQLGENMNFFVFSDQKDNQKRVSDPYVKGAVQVNILNKEYKWRTPLGTLMPLKYCPKDKEELNGSWEYCPWDGEKLILKK